ncbi:MAG: hypothetical protein K2I66_00855 [Bacteroidales bacterium]|nr:hypothetical protein [Bacteroidales bacterium]
MKICRWAAVLGLCLGAWSVSAQDLPDVGYTARVAGLAKGAEGRCIVWYADADMISDGRVELGRAVIGEDGRFVLATDEVFEVLPTYFEIDYYSGSLFVERGKTYALRMEDFDYFVDERLNAFVASNRLPELRYVLTDSSGGRDTTDLNYHLGRYAYLYNRMLGMDFERIYLQKDTLPVVRFLHRAQEEFGEVKSPYFNAYRAYSEALLAYFSGLMSRREIFERYVDGKTVDADNPAQADFLRQFFGDYLATNRFLPYTQVRRIVQDTSLAVGARVKALSDSMGLDYALRNEALREGVLLYALSQEWDGGRLDARAVTQLVEYLSREAKFATTRETAARLLVQRRERFDQHYFTDVKLTDEAGDTLSVDALLEKGKFHYFVFVRADYTLCPDCGTELNRLEKIWSKAGEEVREAVRIFVINSDHSRARYVHDARKRHLPWPYLHFNGNIDWIRRIDAGRFPCFFLVDDKGNILNAHIAAPSSGSLELLFKKMGAAAAQATENAGNSETY